MAHSLQTYLAFLVEPSTEECMENFFKQKTNLIQGLGYSFPVNASAITVVPDNGC